jgi:hypothetical protein
MPDGERPGNSFPDRIRRRRGEVFIWEAQISSAARPGIAVSVLEGRSAMRTRNVLLAALALFLLLGPANAPGQAAPLEQPAPPEVLLWNKLGSLDEVLHSEIGPDGTVIGAAYAFEPAQFGHGYVRKAMGANYVVFPASLLDDLTERGTLELWINPKAANPVPYQYGIFGLVGTPYGWAYGALPQHHEYNLWLLWGDGVSGRGLLGGVRFDSQRAETPAEPAQFVATPGVPFHAALSWDIAGIAGTADTVRVYRDGVLIGSTANAWNPAGADRYDLTLGFGPDSQGYDKFIVDNLVIWNYAKTDFSDRFNEAPNRAPDCSAAQPSLADLWPPNNKFVAVQVLGITDLDGDPLAIAITGIRQDEPVDDKGNGQFAPDGQGVGTDTAQLRAERITAKQGDGRFYHVAFQASDGRGGACSGTVQVTAPKSQAHAAVDGGPIYDSTQMAP